MKNYPIYIAVALVATLSLGALYLKSTPDEKLYDRHNKDGYYDTPAILSSNDENEVTEAYVGGLTKRNKNKHMKKKSKSKRSKKSKK
jgi:hypothetical protein